eukprot:702134-Pleurochrysis_carterae.AAC.3
MLSLQAHSTAWSLLPVPTTAPVQQQKYVAHKRAGYRCRWLGCHGCSRLLLDWVRSRARARSLSTRGLRPGFRVRVGPTSSRCDEKAVQSEKAAPRTRAPAGAERCPTLDRLCANLQLERPQRGAGSNGRDESIHATEEHQLPDGK